MRNHFINTILISCVLCAPVFAQKVEIFGGAQYEHLQSSYNAVGWNASLTGNFKHVLGITADFSGVYNSRRANSSVYTYTLGPVLTARLPVVQPFVHALFGGATTSTTGRQRQRVCHARWRRFRHRASERDRITSGAGRLAVDQVRRPNPGPAGQGFRGHRYKVLKTSNYQVRETGPK